MRAERRARRAARRADRAAARAERLQRRADRARPQRRWRRRLLLGLVAIGVAAGVMGGWQIRRDRQRATDLSVLPATISVEQTAESGRTIVMSQGAADLDDLAAASAVAADRLLEEVEPGVYLLSAPLLVTDGGHLDIVGSTLRLRSDPEAVVGIEADGADVEIRRATITSWDQSRSGPDPDASDGRAYLAITGSVVHITDSRLVALGAADREQTGLLVSSGSTGTIDDLTAVDPYVGLDLAGRLEGLVVSDVDVTGAELAGLRLASARGLSIAEASANGGSADGLLIEGSSEETTLTDLDLSANAGHGVSITGSAGDLVISDSRSFRNGGRGFSVANTRGITLVGNAVWANTSGIGFTGANADATVADNTVTGNRGPGIELGSAGSSVVISGNRLDHNEQGLRIGDGTAEVAGNRIAQNGIGVQLVDTSPRADFSANAVIGNYDTGFDLAEADGLTIEGNEIRRNAHAAFTVRTESLSEPFWDRNDVEGGRFGVERLHEALREQRPLAVLTPVPEYFFVEQDRAFAELLQPGADPAGAAG